MNKSSKHVKNSVTYWVFKSLKFKGHWEGVTYDTVSGYMEKRTFLAKTKREAIERVEKYITDETGV